MNNLKKWQNSTSLIVLGILTMLVGNLSNHANAETVDEFAHYPIYEGDDLGVVYYPDKTHFRLWSPAADKVVLRLYEQGLGGVVLKAFNMKKSEGGTWVHQINEDLDGMFYTFQINQDGEWRQETPDPYAKAVGVNGDRGAIIDLDKTDPEGWGDYEKPALAGWEDIIIYELHIRDLSIHESTDNVHRGKYLAFTETGTKNPAGQSTGIDHLKELGVTHVHLLPSFDYNSVDETRLDEPQFNWGYDPKNYNVPEGSYSADPYNPALRVKEYKQMVQALHNAGIRVVMDVVYNHTAVVDGSMFQETVPDYYYRKHTDGKGWASSSGCGNDTASDRTMMRKFMIDSVKYWAEEYNVDGFRFDLMAIHDIETMNLIRQELDTIDPEIFVYGEGWGTGGGSPLPEEDAALKKHAYRMDRIAAFGDEFRDGVKGSTFEGKDGGFANGHEESKHSIIFGLVGGTDHPQLDVEQVAYSDNAWANNPLQAITYVSCHDGLTLWDKLHGSKLDGVTEEDLINQHKLALTMTMTAQGVPFLHAGIEMARTKFGEHNSYKSPDSINQIDWNWKTKHQDINEYIKQLIVMRKQHPAFRMRTAEEAANAINFPEHPDPNVLIYEIKNAPREADWKHIYIIFNGSGKNQSCTLPDGEWRRHIGDGNINLEGEPQLVTGNIEVAPWTATLVVRVE
jgi:pullulanase